MLLTPFVYAKNCIAIAARSNAVSKRLASPKPQVSKSKGRAFSKATMSNSFLGVWDEHLSNGKKIFKQSGLSAGCFSSRHHHQLAGPTSPSQIYACLVNHSLLTHFQHGLRIPCFFKKRLSAICYPLFYQFNVSSTDLRGHSLNQLNQRLSRPMLQTLGTECGF